MANIAEDKTGEVLSLQAKTNKLLKESKIPIDKITEETRLTFYWLSRFRRNEFPNPSVNKVQKLYEYLTGEKLPI